MNCEPGDIAVIVSAKATGNTANICRKAIGRVVRVKRLRASTSRYCYASEVWEFEEPFKIRYQGKTYTVTGCADDALRPIRDNDGEDETLTWAGHPEKVAA